MKWSLVLFALAILLLVAMRWQPEPWLQSQIAIQAKQNGIRLHYDALQLDGLTLRLEHPEFQTGDMAVPMAFDAVTVEMAWLSLFSGSLAADVSVIWQGQQGRALLFRQGEYIYIQEVDAMIDVADVQGLWIKSMPFPVQASGQVQLTGAVRLDAVKGFPVDGQMNVKWQSAATDLTGLATPLGDYRLTLNAEEDSPAPWQWLLSGGSAVLLTGKGEIHRSEKTLQAWLMGGQIQLEAGSNAGSVSAMLGDKKLQFSLSGSILHPRLHPL